MAAKRSNNWSVDEIQLLIQCWSDDAIIAIMESAKRNTLAYHKIVESMTKEGYTRTKEQVQQKIKVLRQSYDKAKDKISRSGASQEVAVQMCPYFLSIDAFLGGKPLTKPHYMARSSQNVDDDEDIPIPFEKAMPDLPPPEVSTPESTSNNVVGEKPTTPHSKEITSTSTSTQKKTVINVPGKEQRKKNNTGVPNVLTEINLMKEEEQSYMKHGNEMWKQHMSQEEENRDLRIEEKKLMESWMHQQKKEGESMIGMMGEMIGIMHGMRNTNQASSWRYEPPTGQIPTQGYAGDFRQYSPSRSENKSLDYYQL